MKRLAAFFGALLCCGIFATGVRAQKSEAPCCTVTSINAKTGEVTARVTATGQTFSFTVAEAKLLSAMKVGQGVYADLASKQVSVNPALPCCSITAISAPGTPCCAVTSVNSQTGQVTVRENATGRLITFKVGPVDGAKLTQTFKVGTAVGLGPVTGLKVGSRTQLTVLGVGPVDGVVSQITAP